ncbi:MAG TPA: helix-turn-helix domain-containing protein [Mycobacteriales bacterium]|nr:helix-turn-helix domain-containing protein [Mycobacteriales bacterium]
MIGERWSLLILRDAFMGVRRFRDFLVHLDIPRAVLTARLNSLVAAGVLGKQPYQEHPVRYEYTLTAAGLELWPVVHGLASWGSRHASPAGPSRLYLHAACGTELDPAGACPRCGGRIAPGEVEIRTGPGAQFLREDPVSIALRDPHRLLTPITVN